MVIIKRIIFSLQEGFRARHILKRFLVEPERQIYSLTEITAERIDEANVAVLVLDFDGVLANHGEAVPLPDSAEWLFKLSHQLGQQRLAILTNKPYPQRIAYFKAHFPGIQIIQGRKKPYPDGLLEIAYSRGLAMHRILLLDDRLLTGMLATKLASCQGWYFCRPFTNYWRRPFAETFFSCLRVLERCWIRCIG